MATYEASGRFTANAFHDRVEVLKKKTTIAADGTRKDEYISTGTIWANVNIISTQTISPDGVEVGRRLNYRVVIRKGAAAVDYSTRLKFRGKTLILAAPPAEVNGRVYVLDAYDLEEVQNGSD